MFDVGFSELIVIGIVALVVIGPEKLPRVARTIGLLLGRAQRYVNDVKADINREMHLDDLKKMQSEMTNSMRSLEDGLKTEVESARLAVETPLQEASAAIEAPAEAEPELTPSVATYGLAAQIEASESETAAVLSPDTSSTPAAAPLPVDKTPA